MLHKIREAQAEDGFTLIELLVVVIIIGILAAVAIPVFLNQRRKAWDSAAKSDVRNMITSEESYATDNNGAYTGTMANITGQGFKASASVTHGACAYATVTGGPTDAFVVAAKHSQSTSTWYQDSQIGTVQSTTTGLGCTPTLS